MYEQQNWHLFQLKLEHTIGQSVKLDGTISHPSPEIKETNIDAYQACFAPSPRLRTVCRAGTSCLHPDI